MRIFCAVVFVVFVMLKMHLHECMLCELLIVILMVWEFGVAIFENTAASAGGELHFSSSIFLLRARFSDFRTGAHLDAGGE